MKIPLYQSQGQMTREAPGRSISARMSMAGPNAILQQGKVLGTAIQEIGSYAEMKYKMLDETERNEAIFGAKEAIRDTAYRMKIGTDNRVLEGGKDSKWNQEMEAIRIGLTDNMRGSRASRFMFDQEFRVASSNAKFSLQEAIRDKIEQRHKVSQKSIKDQIVAAYGDPSANIEGLKFELASFQEVLARAAKNQLINPELVAAIGESVLPDVAQQLVIGWAGTDLERVMNLTAALNAFDDLGSAKSMDIKEDSQIDAHREFLEISKEGGDYTLQVLLSIQPGDAKTILGKAMTLASKFVEGKDTSEKFEKDIAERIYTLAIGNRLKAGETITPGEIREFYSPPNGFSQDELTAMGASEVNGVTVLDGPKVQLFLQDVLRSNPWFQTQSTMNSALEKSITENNNPDSYATIDNASIVEAIDKAFRVGTMDIDFLVRLKENLTRKTYIDFQAQIEQDANASANELDQSISTYFKEIGNRLGAQIDANTTNNSALGISKGSLLQVVGQIRTKIRNMKSAGTPMDEDAIFKFGEALMITVEKDRIVKLKRQFALEFINTLDDPLNSLLALNLDNQQVAADPRAALDAIYDNLGATQQNELLINYTVLLGLIGRFEAQGTFSQ